MKTGISYTKRNHQSHFFNNIIQMIQAFKTKL